MDINKHIISQTVGNLYWKDVHGRYLGCNDAFAKVLKLNSANEIIGKNDYDFPLEKDLVDKIISTDKQVISTGKEIILEETGIGINNNLAIYLTKKVPLRDENNQIIGLIGTSIDITEKKRIEQELEETRSKLENVLNTIPGHVYWKDVKGIYLGCNDQQAINAGLKSKHEMIGKTDYDMPWKNQADTLRKIDIEVMQTGVSKTTEEYSTLINGTHAIFLSKKVPLYYRDKIIGILGVSLDITDKKQTEKELEETKHKLEGMTVVAASIAHELRTPLISIAYGIARLKDKFWKLVSTYKLAEKAKLAIIYPIKESEFQFQKGAFDSLNREVKAAETFIDMLLTNLSSPTDNYYAEPFSIVNCVNDAIKRYPFQTGQEKLIYWNDKKDDFVIYGSQTLVIHILFNLIKNALFYVTKSGKKNIDARIEIWTEKNKDYNKLYFKDTGTGISADILPHVFDRFFSKTTHGAGIGLSFCKMAMESLGGKIECESTESEYTLFTLAFPHENMHNK